MSLRNKAIRDLADMYYYQGYHSGRWEHEEDMDDSAKEYVQNMQKFADEWSVKYSRNQNDYVYDEDESECYTNDHMGYEIFCLTQKKLIDEIGEDLIRTQNEISSSNKFEQEVASLEEILKSYEKEQYNNVFVLIMNYLGHIDHYCGHSGLVYRMLNNLTFSLEKKAKGELTEDNDGFKHFVESRLLHAKEGL